MTQDGPVAVAVPHDGVDSALRFAAREALVQGCPVAVVGPARPSRDDASPDLLRRACADVEVTAGPGVPVDVLELPEGTVDVEQVLAACPQASLVVVDRSSVLHLVRSLSHGEAGTQARSAVASVPRGWVPLPDEGRPVVVAVDDAFHAESLLAAGIEAAHQHQTWLRVIHAWDLPLRLGPEEQSAMERLWTGELRHRLETQLRELTETVPYIVDVRRGAAADVVLEVAPTALLLLLGRNAPSDGVGHLGRTARTAVRECACPVVLLPVVDAPGEASAEHRRVAARG